MSALPKICSSDSTLFLKLIEYPPNAFFALRLVALRLVALRLVVLRLIALRLIDLRLIA